MLLEFKSHTKTHPKWSFLTHTTRRNQYRKSADSFIPSRHGDNLSIQSHRLGRRNHYHQRKLPMADTTSVSTLNAPDVEKIGEKSNGEEHVISSVDPVPKSTEEGEDRLEFEFVGGNVTFVSIFLAFIG